MAQQSKRLGGILLSGAFRVFNGHSSSSLLQGALPSTYILSRCFGGSKLFVGGLSYRTDEEGLRNAFTSHGEVADVRIITDRESGRSRGFGFVTYLSETDAETALSKMDGHILDGRIIRVDRASARPPVPRPAPAVGDGSDSGSGTSSGPPRGPFFETPPPSGPEDWGSIPSFNAFVSQNPRTDSVESSGDSSSSGKPIESSEAVPALSEVEGKSSESSTNLELGMSATASSQTTCTTISVDGGLPNIESKSANTQSTTISVDGGLPNIESKSASTQSTSTTITVDGGLPSLESKSSSAGAFGSSVSNNAPAPLSSSGFDDLSSFPAFEDSPYQDDPPLPRRRPRPRPRPIPQSSVSNFSFNSPSSEGTISPFGISSENEAGIPKTKGAEFDFGLSGIGSKPLQCEPGARPQGGFDTNIPADLKELPPEPPSPPKPKPLFSMFPLRTLPPDDLPYDTPEADNWSDIGKEPPKYDLSMLFGPGKSFIKRDKELHWDPYDFDEDAKLPPEPEATEASAAS